MVQKVITQLRKEQGYLKCHKCGTKPGTVKAFTDHLEKCYGIVSKTGMVICAVCKVEMPKNDWSKHKYKEHNNLTWREGETPLVKMLFDNPKAYFLICMGHCRIFKIRI